MALEVTYVEQYKESRKQQITTDSISKTLVYIMYGTFFEESTTRSFGSVTEWTDDDEAHRAVYDVFPLYREFQLDSSTTVILLLSSVEIENYSEDAWKVTLVYDLPTQEGNGLAGSILDDNFRAWGMGPDAEDNSGAGWSNQLTQLSFNSSCTEVHKTTSRKLLQRNAATALPAGITAPANMVIDRPAPILATEEEIKGTDVYERDFKFQITQYFNPRRLTYKYARLLYRLTGTTNAGVWFGFPIGSVLFLGASADGDLIQNVPVTFEFAVRPNFKFITTATVLSDPNENTPANMYDQLSDPAFAATNVFSGWCFVDYRYLPIPDANAKSKFMTPSFRFIHQLYEPADFNKLQL